MAPAVKDEGKQIAAQIRAYLAAQPSGTRVILRKMHDTIHAVAPDAVDGFSYRMPVARLDGKVLVWYAGFKNHTSLFPIGDAIRREFAADLEGYETSKGTVRFPLADPLPVGLIKRLVKARIGELRSKS
ncbi:MAG TPA: DUF1801 domain-containing protein [Gemmatimonadaceae bacterium]